MTTDVVLKDLAPQWIASIRDVIPAHRTIGVLLGKLYEALGAQGLEGMGVALWHDQEYKDRDLDVEVGVYLKQAVRAEAPLTVHELPAVTVASIIHHGPFNRISEAYQAVLHSIEANQYRQAGPVRELFLRVSTPVTRDDQSNVTEIQVPVWTREQD